jgi:prepilin peptidase CpaA
MALLLVLLRGRLRLVMSNLGRMLSGVSAPGTDVRAPAQHTSAGTMPYGVAIAIGTIAVLIRH